MSNKTRYKVQGASWDCFEWHSSNIECHSRNDKKGVSSQWPRQSKASQGK